MAELKIYGVVVGRVDMAYGSTLMRPIITGVHVDEAYTSESEGIAFSVGNLPKNESEEPTEAGIYVCDAIEDQVYRLDRYGKWASLEVDRNSLPVFTTWQDMLEKAGTDKFRRLTHGG